MSEDSRYPYTYACDFIRSVAGYDAGGTKLSRSDASQIISTIAEINGINERTAFEKLADHYLMHEDELSNKAAQDLVAVMAKR